MLYCKTLLTSYSLSSIWSWCDMMPGPKQMFALLTFSNNILQAIMNVSGMGYLIQFYCNRLIHKVNIAMSSILLTCCRHIQYHYKKKYTSIYVFLNLNFVKKRMLFVLGQTDFTSTPFVKDSSFCYYP